MRADIRQFHRHRLPVIIEMIDTAVHDAISHTVRIFDIDDLRVIFAARRRDKPSHLQNEPAGQIFEQRAEIAKQRGFVDRARRSENIPRRIPGRIPAFSRQTRNFLSVRKERL